ncbi:MAG: hypothetical protein NZ821_00680 [Gloeomargarita sp. SKYB31]|nr:hypothetical protein [Gloeomargarita sp. SKYB31]
MVREQPWERYTSAQAVLQALDHIPLPTTPTTEVLPPLQESSLLVQSSRWLRETARRWMQG